MTDDVSNYKILFSIEKDHAGYHAVYLARDAEALL